VINSFLSRLSRQRNVQIASYINKGRDPYLGGYRRGPQRRSIVTSIC
jgi:hypothetical protein